jgi:uncharacterized membrane protein YbhN (UPF0104 family)
MSIQIYVNMLSAVIIFVGGMIIALFYPGHLSNQYRVLVALAVLLYFLLRMGQTFFLIKRERRREKEGSDEVTKDGGQDRL